MNHFIKKFSNTIMAMVIMGVFLGIAKAIGAPSLFLGIIVICGGLVTGMAFFMVIDGE